MKKCPFCAEDIQDAAIFCKHCKREIPSRESPTAGSGPTAKKVNPILILAAVGILVAVVLDTWDFSGATNSYLQTGSTASPGVSLSQFQQLQAGMTYGEVVRILGSSGTEMSRSDIANISTVLYQWPGSGTMGANMNAMFQNDKLVNKAQFGLR
jgi:hypothetical protein